MTTPLEHLAGLKIGSVESVSPDEIRVLLELDAPQATALNTGIPTGFPRINSYVLIPNEGGALVGMVVWLGIERSPFPKRRGLKDFDLVDLPFPLRKMSLTPVGTLTRSKDQDGRQYRYHLERGVNVFPSVGDTVILPAVEQLLAIIEPRGTDRRVEIGKSPLALNSPICVDPNKLFGRHLAVLGNTGSGKSCSVAGVIRWSLEQAGGERQKEERSGPVNARFIILDPNGEYADAFADMGSAVRRFQVSATGDDVESLRIAAWMWNSQEWSTFASASPGVQRPLLQQALRDMRAGQTLQEPVPLRVGRLLTSYKVSIEQLVAQGTSGYQGFPASRRFGELLQNVAIDSERHAEQAAEDFASRLTTLAGTMRQIADNRHWTSANSEGYNDFSETEVLEERDAIQQVLDMLPAVPAAGPRSEDAPIPFDVEQLADHLEQLAAASPSAQAATFVATLTMRIRMMLADSRKHPVFVPEQHVSMKEWLEAYVGESEAANGKIVILDLSLLPSDVLGMTIGVLARLVFESLQRYRRLNKVVLPTVLVLEEAHTFVERRQNVDEGTPTPSQVCREVFEKIAREGRKFGLGLVLSSQRPSELSPTVLAQCNTFLLHRLVNDRDQDLVKRLVPDKLGGLLADLPNLPTKQALLLGWATPMPVLVEMRELAKEQCPRSADPDFWEVWTGERERSVDWGKVSDDWTA